MRVEKENVTKIDMSDYLNDDYFLSNKESGIYFYTQEFLSQFDNSRFLHKIYIIKDRKKYIFLSKFSNDKLNLFDEFYSALNLEIKENEYMWIYDEFFKTDMMFMKDEIILTDDNIIFMNECV